jgi:ubiquinone/menaquinone biosynthesis C-methylase UbiE
VHDHEQLKPGSRDYEGHLREEIDHYGRIFDSDEGKARLTQPVPEAWNEVERRAAEIVRASTGETPINHMLARMRTRPGFRVLSLGSGPGGVELSLADQCREAELLCLDVNPNLLELGRRRAEEKRLAVRFEEADLNGVELPANSFDLVFCHASLHHVLELERLAEQIRKTLRRGGELLTVDVITRNGYQMWPETRTVAAPLFRSLPERFRLNHTAYQTARVDDELWESGVEGMECIRSEDILRVLRGVFHESTFVPYFSLSRRFLDTMYGPNYDLARPLDRALLDYVWQLDRDFLEARRLPPETFFGIYRRENRP